MSTTAAPTARAAWLHAALVSAVGLVVVELPTGIPRPLGEIVALTLGASAVGVALRRHRSPAVLAWRGLGAALLFFALGGVAEAVQLAGIAPGTSGALKYALDSAGFAALAIAALGHLTVGHRRRSREAWIDSVCVLLAAGLAVLAVTDGRQSWGTDLPAVSLGIPVITAVVLLVYVPLAISGGGRSVAAMALLGAGLMTVVGYSGMLVVGTAGGHAVGDDLPLFALAAVTLAGRHPSVAVLGTTARPGNGANTGQMVGLGAALLMSPALLLLWSLGHGGAASLLGAGSALLAGIALWRLVALDRETESRRAALSASEARLRLVLENAADVIAIVDGSGSVTYMSPAVQSLLGRPPADYLGRDAVGLADPRDQPRLRAAVAVAGSASDLGAGVVDTDIRVQHASGGTRWVEMRISGRIADAGIEGWVVNFREVTDRKMFEDELRRQAQTDPLTGLLNRTAFNERLVAATGSIDPEGPPAVLFVDIDDFKTVNDSLGHAAGDDLLITVAARLSADVRADDVVARLGGDEFAVLLADACTERLRDVADRLLASLRTPMTLAGTTVSVTASIGGALGASGDTAERLLHAADTAMYDAKRSGKDSRAFLDAAPDSA